MENAADTAKRQEGGEKSGGEKTENGPAHHEAHHAHGREHESEHQQQQYSQESKQGGEQGHSNLHSHSNRNPSQKGHERNAGSNSGIEKNGSENFIIYVLIILVSGFIIYNQIVIGQISAMTAAAVQSDSLSASSTANALAKPLTSVIPKGVPEIYGKEIGISYDDVSASNAKLADRTIAKLSAYDRSITLSGDKLKRYVDVASQISCEYCCGAKSIIFPDGKAACSCAHSYAMRGLAKYLIDKHGSEYTDDQILEELGKWKTLFFPGKISEKAEVLKQKGIEINYINLASNKYRDIEAGASSSGGGMVGGC